MAKYLLVSLDAPESVPYYLSMVNGNNNGARNMSPEDRTMQTATQDQAPTIFDKIAAMNAADAKVVETSRAERELRIRHAAEMAPLAADAGQARNDARAAWLDARKAISAATVAERNALRKHYPAAQHGSCCIFAAQRPCVCRARYECPLHGNRCEGVH